MHYLIPSLLHPRGKHCFHLILLGTKQQHQGFPGGLGVRIQHFHCHESSIPGQGTEILQAVRHSPNKQTNKQTKIPNIFEMKGRKKENSSTKTKEAGLFAKEMQLMSTATSWPITD